MLILSNVIIYLQQKTIYVYKKKTKNNIYLYEAEILLSFTSLFDVMGIVKFTAT